MSSYPPPYHKEVMQMPALTHVRVRVRVLNQQTRLELLKWVSFLTKEKFQLLRETHHYTIHLIDSVIRHIDPKTLTSRSLVLLTIGCLLISCKSFENWDRKLSLQSICEILENKYSPEDLILAEKSIAQFLPSELEGVLNHIFTKVMSNLMDDLKKHTTSEDSKQALFRLRLRAICLMEEICLSQRWSIEDPHLISILIIQKCVLSMNQYPSLQSEWKDYLDKHFAPILKNIPEQSQKWMDEFVFEEETKEIEDMSQTEQDSLIFFPKSLTPYIQLVKVTSFVPVSKERWLWEEEEEEEDEAEEDEKLKEDSGSEFLDLICLRN